MSFKYFIICAVACTISIEALNIGNLAQSLVEGTGNAVSTLAEGTGSAVSTLAEGTGDAVSTIAEGTGNAVSNVAQGTSVVGNTVLATVAQPILSQCSNLKNLIGLSVTDMVDDGSDPDFSELTIDFMSGAYNVTFNLTTAAENILESHFYNTSQKLYVFIHGWNSSPNEETFQEVKDALYDKGKNNVLALDSSKYLQWFYLRSSSYVVFIGKKLAEVLIGLNEEGLSRTDMHLIGHSLGAHIAGFTGKSFENNTATKVGRISGLDAAGPCFSELNEDYRLNSTDADFVDAIHTCAGLAGIAEDVGQIDFWPNGGANQPGCLTITCNHGRAVKLYAESIVDPQAFPAVKCGSWDDFVDGSCDEEDVVYMGFETPSNKTGTYYLRTASSSLFGLGINGTRNSK